jgi:hypothetical protein
MIDYQKFSYASNKLYIDGVRVCIISLRRKMVNLYQIVAKSLNR